MVILHFIFEGRNHEVHLGNHSNCTLFLADAILNILNPAAINAVRQGPIHLRSFCLVDEVIARGVSLWRP